MRLPVSSSSPGVPDESRSHANEFRIGSRTRRWGKATWITTGVLLLHLDLLLSPSFPSAGSDALPSDAQKVGCRERDGREASDGVWTTKTVFTLQTAWLYPVPICAHMFNPPPCHTQPRSPRDASPSAWDPTAKIRAVAFSSAGNVIPPL